MSHEFGVRRMNLAESELTPLMEASLKGDIDAVDSLISKGADINEANDKNLTALTFGAAHGQSESVNALLRHGANPNLTDGTGRTPLMWASAFGYAEIVRALLTAGADVNAASESADDLHTGETSLMLAAWSGYVPVMRLLIEAGANVNAKGGPLSGTALHSALYHGHAAAVQVLVNCREIELNEADGSGSTAKEKAVKIARTEIVQMFDDAEARRQKA